MKLILPDCSRIRIGHLIRQGIDQQIGSRRRDQIFLLALRLHELSLDEIIDDRRPCRLGADTIDILQLLLRLWILDVFMDFLHTGQQSRRRKAYRRLGRALRDRTFLPVHTVLLLHGRQGLVALIVLDVLLVLVAFPAFGLIHGLPAQVPLRAATGGKEFLFIGDFHLGLIIGMHRIELSDIATRDQMIEIAFLGGHRQHIGLDGRRDDRMMGRDLLIVPGPALDLHIRFRGPLSHQVITGIREIAQNSLRIAELIRRQVFAV